MKKLLSFLTILGTFILFAILLLATYYSFNYRYHMVSEAQERAMQLDLLKSP